MIRLILVAHAETDWNTDGRYQGYSDVPLNERGRHQAAQLRDCLATDSIDAAYVSDLRRAWDTAAVIAQDRGLTLRPEPRLRELNFGDWEGLRYAAIREANPMTLDAWVTDPEQVAPPGGETLLEMTARLRSLLGDLRRRTADGCETVLLVGHRGSLRILTCMALGLPSAALWRFRLDLASVSELDLSPREAVLARLNDTHHLRENAHAG
jgi:alpha-ribazole phosphatase